MSRFKSVPLKAIAASLVLIVMAGLAYAQLATPPLTGRVVDNAGLLDPTQQAAITQKLAAHEAGTGEQIVVVTVPSLEGDVLEDVSLRFAREWGIGQADFNNGAVLLIAQADKKIRIEAGYGLEDRLTDAQSGLIIRNKIAPLFRAGDFTGGIAAGVDAMIGVLGGTRLEASPRRENDEDPAPLLFLMIFGLFFFGPAIASAFRPPLTPEQKRKRRKQRGGGFIIPGGILGGGFGGGGGGFGGGFGGGGGGFGGGGASGGW